MTWNLPNRTIAYKGGFTMVSRDDDPTYQCTKCYKPWFDDDLQISPMLAHVECPNCGQPVRKLTAENPLEK